MLYSLLLVALGWWIGIAAAQAQTTTPGMGPTSPVSVPSAESSSSNSTSSGLGIPLGSTEINTPGVSPLIMPCPNASSNGAFDGGGSSLSNNCGSGASTTGASGAASMSGVGGAMPGSSESVVGSGIPLGATDLGIPGESQTTAVPGPCSSPQGMSNSVGSTSSALTGSC
jgi:hypothetical protein